MEGVVTQAGSGNCSACVSAALPSWLLLCFCSNFHCSWKILVLFLASIFALIGTLLVNKWKFLHLKSGDITEPSKFLNPQQPEGRCARTTGEDLAVLMKLNWFPFADFRDTFVAGRVDLMLKRECELERGVFSTWMCYEMELSKFKCSAILSWVNSWERTWLFQPCWGEESAFIRLNNFRGESLGLSKKDRQNLPLIDVEINVDRRSVLLNLF